MWEKGEGWGGGEDEDEAGKKATRRGERECRLSVGDLDANPYITSGSGGRHTSSPQPAMEHMTKMSEQTITYNPLLLCRKADLNEAKVDFRNDSS